MPGFDAKTERTWSSKAIVDAPGWWSTTERLEGGTLRLRGVMGRTTRSPLVRGAVNGGKPTADTGSASPSGSCTWSAWTAPRSTLTDPEDIKRPSCGELELLVTHVGPYITARLYCVRSARHLASVFARDETHRAGVSAVTGKGSRRAHGRPLRDAAACKSVPVHARERGRRSGPPCPRRLPI